MIIKANTLLFQASLVWNTEIITSLLYLIQFNLLGTGKDVYYLSSRNKCFKTKAIISDIMQYINMQFDLHASHYGFQFGK